jgi:hypothetical protein
MIILDQRTYRVLIIMEFSAIGISKIVTVLSVRIVELWQAIRWALISTVWARCASSALDHWSSSSMGTKAATTACSSRTIRADTGR